MPRFAIPLDNIQIAKPCPASWDAMSGDERVRFCSRCQLHVYNVSALSRAEAEALIRKTEGRLCIGYYRRRDGRILTQDCPAGLRAARRWLALAIGAVAMGLFVVLGVGVAWRVGTQSGDVGSRRLRDIEPFHTFMEWIDPTPPPPQVFGW